MDTLCKAQPWEMNKSKENAIDISKLFFWLNMLQMENPIFDSACFQLKYEPWLILSKIIISL